MVRSTLRIVFALSVVLLLSPVTQAQRPRMLEPAEYGRWEQLVAQRTPLSPDGRWLVYGITRANRDNELRVQPSDGGAVVKAVAIRRAARLLGRFALAGLSDRASLKSRKPSCARTRSRCTRSSACSSSRADARRRSTASSRSRSVRPGRIWRCGATRLSLPTPATHSSRHAPPAPDETVAPGTTLVVRELATGRDTTFGSVSEIAWQDKGTLLAFAVTVEGGVGNGLQLFDTATGTLRVLDSSASTYTGLSWRKDSAALAALRSQSNDAREGPTHVLLAWPDVTRTPTPRESSMQARADWPATCASSASARRAGPKTAHASTSASRHGPPKPARSERSRAVAPAGRDEQQPRRAPGRSGVAPEGHHVMAKQKLDARRDRQRVDAGGVVDRRRPLRPHRHAHRARKPRRFTIKRARWSSIPTRSRMERSIGRVVANAGRST